MKISINGDRATLHTNPTPRLLAILPRLEGHRAWLKAGGLAITASGHNLEVLSEAFPDATQEAHGDIHLESHFDLPTRGAAYRPKTVPYPHQIRALEKARTKKGFALFKEQGTGKTWVAISRAGELWARGKITGVLILSKKGVHRQWIASQIPEHFGAGWSGKFWQGAKWVEVEGSPDPAGELHFAAINFDGAKSPKGKKACLEFIALHKGRCLLIGDETQEIKNASSARHKAAAELAKATQTPYRLALTGTPIAKDLTDEWAQLKWLDDKILGMRYATSFRAEYCIMGGFEGRAVVGHRNIERFRERVDPFTFRATKDELGILPKSYRRWQFNLSKNQKKAIKGLKQDLRHQIETGEVASASTAAVALIKIQQASNGFLVSDEGDFIRLDPPKKSPRISALMEVLDSYEGKTIVWARFRKDIKMIAEALSESSISFVEYHGGTSDKDRTLAVDDFILEGGARIFLANPQAGGTGLNLQGLCRHAVYYSNSFNAIDRWQSEDRIHRIGTVGTVSYTDIVCKGAVDALLLNNLKRKKGISDLALEDINAIIEEDF